MSVAPSQVPSVSNQPSTSFAPSISTHPSISTKPSLSRTPSIKPSLTKIIFTPVPSISVAPSVSISVAPSVSQHPTGQCLWYPDFSPGVNRCRNDCNEPYYMRDSISLPRSRPSSGHWYVDWNKYFCVRKFPIHSSIEEIAHLKNDPNPPAYVGSAMFWEQEHKSLESCCAEMLGHQDNRLCVQDSIDAGQDHYTYLWYANARSQTCERDCPRALDPEQCDGHPYDITVTLYDNPETCCKERLSWLDNDQCVKEAFPSAAGRKFIDDSNPWFFHTNEECCEAHFSWDQECLDPPVDDEETLWYPDCSPGAARCLDDGNQPHHFGRNALNWLYKTYEECCATHFSWALNECANNAEEDSNHPSNLFFADLSSNSCLQDCEPGPFGCAIAPPSVTLYASIEACCSLGQWYVDFEYCTLRSYGKSSKSSKSTGKSYTSSSAQTLWSSKSSKAPGNSYTSSSAQTLWYPDCSPGATRCRDDGNQPEHFEKDKLNWLYKTPGECCNTHFSWALNDCVNNAMEGSY